MTYLLVDGENIDRTLGNLLEQKPEPGQRPRWQHVLAFAERVWEQPVRGLFFLNVSARGAPTGFVQALMAIGYRPVPLTGRPDEKVVDLGIRKTLVALRDRDADVLLASHDGDFAADLGALAGGGRRVGVVAFTELVSQALRDVQGMEVFDLETDTGAFEATLPRVRVTSIDDLDPDAIL